MLDFKRVSLEDKPLIEHYFRCTPKAQLNYSFEVLYLWRDACEFEICEYNGFLLIKTFIRCNHNFLYPLGKGDLKDAVMKMKQYSESHYCEFNLFQITEEEREELAQLLPGMFVFTPVPEEFEYVYLREKLATLTGKKLQPKRNHINALTNSCVWSYEEIDAGNIEECKALNERWMVNHQECDPVQLHMENEAIIHALDDFFTLNLHGGAIRIDGKIEAFSIGCPLTSDMYLVLFEKANPEIRGAYPLMNREFVKHEIPEQYLYVNRAEDAGDEGLRQAKLSYHPDKLDILYMAAAQKEK
ncbi:MAG: DUF2156 domain-containing protein [Bacteroidales bacterium]